MSAKGFFLRMQVDQDLDGAICCQFVIGHATDGIIVIAITIAIGIAGLADVPSYHSSGSSSLRLSGQNVRFSDCSVVGSIPSNSDFMCLLTIILKYNRKTTWP